MKCLALVSQRFLGAKNGPTAVDFTILLALIAVVWLTAIASIAPHANTTF